MRAANRRTEYRLDALSRRLLGLEVELAKLRATVARRQPEPPPPDPADRIQPAPPVPKPPPR